MKQNSTHKLKTGQKTLLSNKVNRMHTLMYKIKRVACSFKSTRMQLLLAVTEVKEEKSLCQLEFKNSSEPIQWQQSRQISQSAITCLASSAHTQTPARTQRGGETHLTDHSRQIQAHQYKNDLDHYMMMCWCHRASLVFTIICQKSVTPGGVCKPQVQRETVSCNTKEELKSRGCADR